MNQGLITMITTADMQQAFGNNLEELAKYCIVNQFSIEDANEIKNGKFSDYVNRFLKLSIDSGISPEQESVQEEIQRLLSLDKSGEYMAKPAGQTVVAIECYRKNKERTEAIRNPKTNLSYATMQDNIADFLTTFDIDGKSYDHLDMVIEHKLVQG